MGLLDSFRNPQERGEDDKPAGGVLHAMSLLSSEHVWPEGIPPQAAAAAYRGDEPPERLHGNPSFIEFMHDVIRRCAPNEAEIQSAAQAEGEGYFYIVDAFTPDGIFGNVPPEDIIGGFRVEGGVVGSYFANPKYVVYRDGRGLVQLPGVLHDALVEALRGLPPVKRMDNDPSGGV